MPVSVVRFTEEKMAEGTRLTMLTKMMSVHAVADTAHA